MTIGDPTLDTTDIGPLIRPREVDRVHEWVREAIDEGAECLVGGEKEHQHQLSKHGVV